MNVADPAAEYLRLAEHYRQMKDEELLELVPQSDTLTPAARQALATEVRQRGLRVEVAAEKPVAAPSNPAPKSPRPSFNPPSYSSPSPRFRDQARDDSAAAGSSNHDESEEDESEEEDPYEEDRKLFTLCTVWSLRDALKVQRILDVAGIPFYMGPEKATGVDQVKSDFSKGVGVHIMRVGWPWAYQAMRDKYFPEDNGPSELLRDPKDLVVRCPRCQSTDVVFDGLKAAVAAPSEDGPRKFRWTCHACLNQWEDDGVGKEE